MVKNYRKTLLACYLGFITQAITANFAPLLFLKFHTDYGIPLGKIALISGTFFVAQLIVDALCARFADHIGYRKCVIASEFCSAAGLIGLAFLPELLERTDRGAGKPHCRGVSLRAQGSRHEPAAFVLLLGVGGGHSAVHAVFHGFWN